MDDEEDEEEEVLGRGEEDRLRRRSDGRDGGADEPEGVNKSGEVGIKSTTRGWLSEVWAAPRPYILLLPLISL